MRNRYYILLVNIPPYYEEARRLLNMLRLILPVASEAIPDDSIIREFIGGSCFHE